MSLQPIESAPKDGTKVLIYWPGSETHPADHYVARWDADFCLISDGRPPGAWKVSSREYVEPSSVTHWMRLPVPQ